MSRYSLTHLSNGELLKNLSSLVARDRATTADLLAHIAEVDERRLYAPAGYSSMHAYCVEKLGFDDEVAYKRVQVARAARRFPAIFAAVLEGRLTLTSALLLAPRLTPENAAELLAEAEQKTKYEIELLLARRFPRPDLPTVVRPLAPVDPPRLDPDPVDPGALDPDPVRSQALDLDPVQISEASFLTAPETCPPTQPQVVVMPAPYPRVKPLSPQKFGLQVTISKETHDKLRRAQDLLGNQVPAGDIAAVLNRALDALLGQLEMRKCGRTSRPRKAAPRPSSDPRRIPAHVKRAVWHRDGGRCTFIGDGGKRCDARRGLEFDHIEPVARGGTGTIGNLRLRCRAHNQLEAEREFGHALMKGRREAAQLLCNALPSP